MQVFLHGGQDKLEAWLRQHELFGHDPELRNTLEFNDMTPHEMHEDLWRRMKRVLERHGQEFMDKSTIKPPYIDMSTYFQSSLPLTLHLSMFRLTMENLANDE